MHNVSERKHLTICIVNVPKRPLANKNDNKSRWGFQIISAATIRHFSKCVHSCAVLSHSVVSHSLRLHELEPARLLCPWDFPGKILERVVISYSRGSSRPRDQTHVSLASGFFTLSHLGSPVYTHTHTHVYIDIYIYIYSFTHCFPLWFITRFEYSSVCYSLFYLLILNS